MVEYLPIRFWVQSPAPPRKTKTPKILTDHMKFKFSAIYKLTKRQVPKPVGFFLDVAVSFI